MVFTILDEDGSGTVELAEVTNAMEAMGMNVSKESLAYLTSHCKEEKGSMTFEEFMDCYSGKDIWKGLEAIRGVASGQGDVRPEHDDKPKHNVDLPLFLWAPAYQRMKQFNWIMKIEARERSGAKAEEEVTLSSRRLRKETFWGERQAHSMALRKKMEYKRQIAAMESINRQPMKRRHPKYTKPQTAEKPLDTDAGHSSDSDHTSEGEKDDLSETGGVESGEIGEVGEVGDVKPVVEGETSEFAQAPKSKYVFALSSLRSCFFPHSAVVGLSSEVLSKILPRKSNVKVRASIADMGAAWMHNTKHAPTTPQRTTCRYISATSWKASISAHSWRSSLCRTFG
jgi:hypothetical protein